jgi:hypothetical protein
MRNRKLASSLLAWCAGIGIHLASDAAVAAELLAYRGTEPGCPELAVGAGRAIAFSAGAASASGSLDSVRWYVDGRLIESRAVRSGWSEDELRFARSFTRPGSHSVSMIAFDAAGNRATVDWRLYVLEAREASAPISCRVWPAEETGRVTAGVPETFAVTVTDPDADVNGIEWYVDGRFIGAQYRAEIGGEGHLTVFSRRFTLHAGGETVTVSAVPFDRGGRYGDSLFWRVEVEPRPRFLYVGMFERILPSRAERQKLVDFVIETGITHVALYRLHRIFPRGCGADCCGESMRNLTELILALRATGVERVYGAVGSADYYRNHVDDFAQYFREHAQGRTGYAVAPNGFDGVVTESEFWRDPSRREAFAGFMGQLADLREELPPTQEITVYAAEARYVEAEAIAAFADRILLASYVADPGDAYRKVSHQLPRYAISRTRPTEVWPILSAENATDKASFCRVTSDRESFMGDWLRDPRRSASPVLEAEERFLRDWKAEPEPWSYGVHVGGFAWFEYNLLEDDLRSLDGNVAPRACQWYEQWDDPYEPVPPATLQCGIQTVTLRVNQSHTFHVEAWDHDGNLTGTLWSGWEHPAVHYDAAGRPDRQYVSGTVGGSGDHALFARRYRFSAPGEYEIRVRALDRRESYGPELFWRVRVEDE